MVWRRNIAKLELWPQNIVRVLSLAPKNDFFEFWNNLFCNYLRSQLLGQRYLFTHDLSLLRIIHLAQIIFIFIEPIYQSPLQVLVILEFGLGLVNCFLYLLIRHR